MSHRKSILLNESWKQKLISEFDKNYMKNLREFLKSEKSAGKVIYPNGREIFRAFDLTPYDQVRVVILGQDPYHGPKQANGLCFSVNEGIRLPPSLQNIFKELKDDLGVDTPKSGDLTRWAKNGVLLLNSVLTVENSQAASHQGRGWEQFTDKIIRILNDEKKGLVFILWGAFAQRKGAVIDRDKHHIITSPHPSPLSSHRGFFGSKPFSKTNNYFRTKGLPQVDWSL